MLRGGKCRGIFLYKIIKNIFYIAIVLASIGWQGSFADMSQTSVSNMVTLTVDSSRQEFNSQIWVYEDAKNYLGISQILNLPSHEWTQNGDSTPSFGVSPSTFWVKFSLKNIDQRINDYILLCDYGALDQLEAYWVEPESLSIKNRVLTGDHKAYDSRPVSHVTFAFPVRLAKSEVIDVYLKVRSNGNIVVPLSFTEKSVFYKKQKLVYMVYAIILAALLLTALNNFFIYFRTKELVFLVFSFFSLFMMLLGASQTRLTAEFLWPNSTAFGEFFLLASISGAGISHLWFSIIYLALQGIYRKLFELQIFLSACILASTPLLGYSNSLIISLLSVMSISALSLFVGAILWFKGQKTAKLYTLAWSLLMVGVFVSASIRFGITPYYWFTEYLSIIGALFTTVALSMILGNRIQSEKEERIEAQQAGIIHLEKYQDLFENSVEGLFIMDNKFHFIAANPQFLRMFGYGGLESLRHSTNDNLQVLFEDGHQVEFIRSQMASNEVIVGYEVRLKNTLDESFMCSICVRLVRSKYTKGYNVEGSVIDISERKKTEQELLFLASHDPLTGIFNRRAFEDQLRSALDDAGKNNNTCSILYLDLDQFKVLNDTCGHTAGDILLRELTQVMDGVLAGRGVFARLGGDEFGVLFTNKNEQKVYAIAMEFLTLIKNYRFTYNDRIFNSGVSIGLVHVTDSGSSIEDIMSIVDAACYVAKDAGGSKIHVYSAESVELKKRRTQMDLVISINNALENNLFELYCQAIAYSDDTDNKLGYEVLVRMRDEHGSLVMPDAFIPAAEQFNLMGKVDKWVIENAFKYFSSHKDIFNDVEHYTLNLSGHSMTEESFSEFLMLCFRRYNIPHHKICFEITETAAVYNFSCLLDLMKDFQRLGCKFSLDDFGSGFSSYGYLKSLPVDYLKIDGSFIVNIDVDRVDYAMVKSINEVASALDMKTIAEFVETDSIIKKLEEIGVNYLQGYGVEKPKKMLGIYSKTV